MYEIKPIFEKSKVQVDAPTCMYKMKPVNDEVQSGAALTNGLDGAVSQHHTIFPPTDILHQIENVLKVFVPSHITTTTISKLKQTHPQSLAHKKFRIKIILSQKKCIYQCRVKR